MSDAAPVKEAAEILVGREAFLDAARKLPGQARMRIALLSFSLDARVFGDGAFVDAVREFVLRHERAQLRVLVNDPDETMRRAAHRLVELGRRLTSRIHFRQLLDERRALVEEVLIVDEAAVLHRDRPDQLEARHYRYAPLEARQRLKNFDALWEESVPARAFSDLRL